MSKSQLKEVFDIESKHGAFYTEGNVEWHDSNLYCHTSTHISVFDTEKGLVISKLAEEEPDAPDTLQTFTKGEDKLITSHRSGLLKLWTLQGELVKQWRYLHKGPIARLNLRGETLASAGSDGVVRIWNLQYQMCRLALKGCIGVVNVIEFHPVTNELFASGDDGKIYLYELKNGEPIKIFSGHFAKVTSLSFHYDNKYFVTSGRDKAIILWDKTAEQPLKTIPIAETIESVICLPSKFKIPNFKCNDSDVYVATGGDRGIIRIWNVTSCKEIYIQPNSLVNKSQEEGGLAIFKLIFNSKLKSLAVVTADRNIIIHDLKTFCCVKQFIGFSDEILDIIYFGEKDEYLIVATNSIDIKFYENSTMNCRILKGHTDLVLSLNKSPFNPTLFASSAKDNSIRIWVLTDDIPVCIGVGTRHTASVTSVAITTNFIVSGSEDTCVKVWEIPKIDNQAILNCLHTEVAHKKTINCVSISPNDKIIATASQDKTIKLWSETLSFLGTLKGHRRGVWCIRFSPVDQVLLSSSADCMVKLWSIAELSCLKTFEGHDSSVLRIDFLSQGMQILSAGSDGLLKLINIKTSETVASFDEHDGRIWALAINKDESQFVSGGADSLLLKWKDVTEDKRQERLKEQEEMVLQEQQLMNCIQNEQFLKALKLALRLNKPLQVLKIVQNIIKRGETGLSDTVSELHDEQKEQLLKVAADWNTNSRYCQPAQLVLNVLLHELQSGRFKPVGLGGILEGLLPYTERHFNRLTQLMQDLHFITYTINCMQPHAKSM